MAAMVVPLFSSPKTSQTTVRINLPSPFSIYALKLEFSVEEYNTRREKSKVTALSLCVKNGGDCIERTKNCIVHNFFRKTFAFLNTMLYNKNSL